MKISIKTVEQIVRVGYPHKRGDAETEIRISTHWTPKEGVMVRAQPTNLVPVSWNWKFHIAFAGASHQNPDFDPARRIAIEMIEYATTGQVVNTRSWDGKLTHGPVSGLGLMDLADAIRSLVDATDDGQPKRK